MITAGQVLKTIFESVDCPNECPDECQYLIGTEDGYGTGDSPTTYDCSGSPDECPRVKELLSEVFGEADLDEDKPQISKGSGCWNYE